MAKINYDLVVIGSGPAGSSLANTCNKKGMKTAVVDYLFGGTCALRGCTPKKAMETVSSLYWKSKHLQGKGFPHQDFHLNWRDLVAHKQQFTNQVPAKTKMNFREAGIDPIESKISFINKNTLQCENGKKIKADKIVIATGAKPRNLSFSGHSYIITSDELLTFPQLPKRIVFAGGGYIGFEMAHIVAACGAEVTIVSKDEMPLSHFDADIVGQIIKATLEKGIQIRTGEIVSKVKKKDSSYHVEVERSADGRKQSIQTDLVVHSAGRTPNIENLNLKKAKIKSSDNRIEVNEYLQSVSHKNIYAIGDVNGKFPFTPVGNFEAEIATHNILNNNGRKMNYEGIPVVMFTYPKMAMVGKTERSLKEAGKNFDVIQSNIADWLIEKSLANPNAGYKVFVEKRTKKILGAHLVGSEAHEIINLFGMAMQNDIRANKIQEMTFAYPTAGNWLKSMVKT